MDATSKHAPMPTSSNRAIAWVLVVIAALANIAAYIFNWYVQFWWFDEVIHAYTIFALTLVLALYAYGTVLTGATQHPLLLVITVAAIGVGIGGVWEVAEWLYDLFLTQHNTIKGTPDRLIDLVMDTLGGLVAGWITVKMANHS